MITITLPATLATLLYVMGALYIVQVAVSTYVAYLKWRISKPQAKDAA